MKFFLAISLGLLFNVGHGQHKKICITIDDLPAVTYGVSGNEFKWELTRALVKAMVDVEVPGIGYVNESKLYDGSKLDTSRVSLLRHWLASGLSLGNHTFGHKNYHRVSFEEFTDDVLKGERVTRELVREYGSELRYFRHPYLRSGLRAGHTDSLKSFLKTHGYTEAPVTIDNDEYLFAFAYGRAYRKNDQVLMEKIGKDYLLYMEAKLLYFEKQSEVLFGRNISQILLIHANWLNANYLDDLIGVYRSHGYEFISQEEALLDDAYEEQVTVFGDWGISWIDRWALSRGKKGEFFEADPKIPEYIRELTR